MLEKLSCFEKWGKRHQFSINIHVNIYIKIHILEILTLTQLQP